MGVRHAGVLPVRQLREGGTRLRGLAAEEKVVADRVDVGKASVLRPGVRPGLQPEDGLLGLPVVPVQGLGRGPQGLVELDLPPDIEVVGDLEAQPVKLPEPLHALPQVPLVPRVADPHLRQVPGNLVAGLRVQIHRVVAEALPPDGGIDDGLLPAADELLRPFAGDTHDVACAPDREHERPVGHALLQDADVCDVLLPGVKNPADGGHSPGLEAPGAGVQLPELLIGVDLYRVSRRQHPDRHRHPVAA